MSTTLRISHGTLAFANLKVREQLIDYQPYALRNGVSMAANLREAFTAHPDRAGGQAQAMVDSPLMLLPVEEYRDASTLGDLYGQTFTGYEGYHVDYCVLPDLNVVAAFAVNKDVRQVLADRFESVRYLPVIQPVVSYLHRRGTGAMHRQLYAYLHDKEIDICSFNRNRFRFYNRYDASHQRDAVYFLLYVWNQLAFDAHADELHLCGDVDRTLQEDLQRYLRHVHTINPAAEFNRAPVTNRQDIPFDVMTLFIKGR
ncbi:MAG: DUF3822 family protein [Prevotella sp.]|nr:DUF3822 family protein [Prevotella sp.]